MSSWIDFPFGEYKSNKNINHNKPYTMEQITKLDIPEEVKYRFVETLEEVYRDAMVDVPEDLSDEVDELNGEIENLSSQIEDLQIHETESLSLRDEVEYIRNENRDLYLEIGALQNEINHLESMLE